MSPNNRALISEICGRMHTIRIRRVLLTLGALLLIDSAQTEIARALEIAPHFALAKVLNGAIDLETEDYQAATTVFQQAFTTTPVWARHTWAWRWC